MALGSERGAVVVASAADAPAALLGCRSGAEYQSDAGVFDRAGNPSDTTTFVEPGAADRDW